MAQNNDDQVLNEFEKIKNDSIFTLTKLINLYGLSFSESRLFSFMFLENNPMTLDEMSQALGMSKTSMSTGVRSLQDVQMVERTWKKGIRKDLYIAEEDLYKSFSNSFVEEWKMITEHNLKEFKTTAKKLESLSMECDDFEMQTFISNYSKKVDDIIEFHKWLSEVFREVQNKIDNMKSE